MTRSARLRVTVGIVVAVVVALAIVLATRFGEDPRAVTSPVLGKVVPARPLPLLDGTGAASLTEFRDEVLVVNFWASWCVPCRAEHGELEAARRRYEGRDVRFVGIVYQDDPEAATAFLERLGRGYDHYIDAGSRTAIDFGLFGVPETFYVDRDGTVQGKTAGPVDTATVVEAVDRLLADG
jgi:cytochrome c biogenesis protein CcmG/thiol:disulfide interchange protein DsbE